MAHGSCAQRRRLGGWVVTGIEVARATFNHAGLQFPTLPSSLAAKLKEEDPWIFSTRGIPKYPYFLDFYEDELQMANLEAYAILAHGGHSFNSYAIQYYIVYGAVRILLHHGWGGVYMDPDETTLSLNCRIARIDEIMAAAAASPWSDSLGPLTVVASDFYGSTYVLPDGTTKSRDLDHMSPDAALDTALAWLEVQP